MLKSKKVLHDADESVKDRRDGHVSSSQFIAGESVALITVIDYR